MIIDGHTHSSEISRCSHVTVKELIDIKKSYGYDGVVLTNHNNPSDCDNITHGEWSEQYIATYKKGKEYADSVGFKFIFGIEVTIVNGTFGHYLLYGITEDFIKNSPCLPKLTQKELFELANANGIFMAEAHPFRNGFEVGNLEYMHGIEINCKTNDFEMRDKAIRLTRDNGKKLICGTDYHGAVETVHGGLELPSGVNDSVDLAKYLFESQKDDYKFWIE